MADAGAVSGFAGAGWAQAAFTIPSGQDGSNVDMADLGRPYHVLHISCADAGGIDSTTTLGIVYALLDDDTPVRLYERSAPATIWASGNLPTSGTFGFYLDALPYARRLRLVLSKGTTSAVTFTITGYEPARNR